MTNLKRYLKLALNSTINLIVAGIGLHMLLWISVSLGAYISGFDGQIVWKPFIYYARAIHWSRFQVMALYLFPYLVLLVVFILLSFKWIFFRNYSRATRYTYAWLFFFIILWIFFLPIWDVYNKHGFYYALSWFGFSRLEQYLFGLITFLGYLYYLFHLSLFFSLCLDVPVNKFLNKRQIVNQLVYIWYLPVIIFTLLIYVVSGMKVLYPVNYFLIGIFVTTLINLPYIIRYRVIIH